MIINEKLIELHRDIMMSLPIEERLITRIAGTGHSITLSSGNVKLETEPPSFVNGKLRFVVGIWTLDGASSTFEVSATCLKGKSQAKLRREILAALSVAFNLAYSRQSRPIVPSCVAAWTLWTQIYAWSLLAEGLTVELKNISTLFISKGTRTLEVLYWTGGKVEMRIKESNRTIIKRKLFKMTGTTNYILAHLTSEVTCYRADLISLDKHNK